MAAPTIKISLKLVIDSKSQKVLFAEAGKDFVDFLFNILSLPVGTVIRLVNRQRMVGCLASLYGSIGYLRDTYMQSEANENTLLASNSAANAAQLLFPNMQSSTNFYRCSKPRDNLCLAFKTNDPDRLCSFCLDNNVMNHNVAWDSGFTYMIMDDLGVRPMSSISRTTLLNSFNIQDAGVLEEKVIEMEENLGIKLLRASLQSKTVLTDVFLSHLNRMKAAGF